jgi:hypothetical protein
VDISARSVLFVANPVYGFFALLRMTGQELTTEAAHWNGV